MVRVGVKDRLTGQIVYKSRPAMYKIAHDRAEAWCKKHLGERGEIVDEAGWRPAETPDRA